MFYSNFLVKKFREWLRGSGEGEEETRADDLDEEDDSFSEVDPFNPFAEPVAIEIRDVFDLHSIPPRQVKAVVEEYLREAHAAGFRTVRIIHGKGVGAQRETVRKILSRTPFITSFSDAPPDEGGWGATIAHLSEKS